MPADFPYLTNPSSLRKFLEKIRTVGAPEKVTIAYLELLGFKSTNDRPIIPALKFLGFVDTSGTPKENWQKYRPRETAGAVLAVAVRTAYSDLFAIYPLTPNAKTTKLNESLGYFSELLQRIETLRKKSLLRTAVTAKQRTRRPTEARIEI
jgi:hypothetical protein